MPPAKPRLWLSAVWPKLRFEVPKGILQRNGMGSMAQDIHRYRSCSWTRATRCSARASKRSESCRQESSSATPSATGTGDWYVRGHCACRKPQRRDGGAGQRRCVFRSRGCGNVGGRNPSCFEHRRGTFATRSMRPKRRSDALRWRRHHSGSAARSSAA